ncbi:MAG: ParB/RepB/Spo0J family partition protein [Actinomycetota bacterium]|nr:ParB/RepB/Spo0J family partition protein [Actinomycetota bacterium]
MVARRPGLGKGLDALIPSGFSDSGSDSAARGASLVEIPVGDLSPNPNQPRVHFDEESLSDLSASIREIGVLQPLLVRRLADGSYQLIAGERRWRAAQRAGLATVPAVVKTTDDMSSVEQALVENLHRQDLAPLEEAGAYQQLIDDFSLTHDDVAKRVGKSRSSITNSLRLLALPAAIQAFLADGRLSAGHAKALLGTPDRAFQEQLARRAATEGWSVRSIEEAIRDRGGDPPAPVVKPGKTGDDSDTGGTVTKLPPAGLLELENQISEHLSTRVNVRMNSNKKGAVTIEFAGLDDLERLYYLMMGSGPVE